MPAAIPVVAAVAGGAIAASGAKSAARTQSDAADRATQAQRDIADQQIGLQRDQFNRITELQEPFRQAGLAGQNALMYALGLTNKNDPRYLSTRNRLAPQYTTAVGGGGSVERSWDLDAATDAEMAKQPGYGALTRDFSTTDFETDPGYQWRMSEGMKALDRGAAARGMFNSGRAMKDILRFSQGLASEEYGNAFNRFQINRGNKLNPLMAIAGVGQTATNQLGQAGQAFTTGATGALGAYGEGQATNTLLGGASRAAGQIGYGNALTRALGQAYNGWQNQSAYDREPNALQAAFSQTRLGSSGFGTGLAYGNDDYGNYF